jgi:hypothetical protein
LKQTIRKKPWPRASTEHQATDKAKYAKIEERSNPLFQNLWTIAQLAPRASLLANGNGAAADWHS